MNTLATRAKRSAMRIAAKAATMIAVTVPAMVLLAGALAVTALPADAQTSPRPTDEELQRQDDKMLDEMLEKVERDAQARSAGKGPKHPKLPPQDPCALLTVAEVGAAAIATAQPGKRDYFNEEQGTSRCVWHSVNGVLLLQLELVGPIEGREGDASKMPAYRKVAGVGDEAMVWVMPRQPPAVPYDTAFGAARARGIGLRLISIELTRQGAEPATRAIEKLMKAAAARL